MIVYILLLVSVVYFKDAGYSRFNDNFIVLNTERNLKWSSVIVHVIVHSLTIGGSL